MKLTDSSLTSDERPLDIVRCLNCDRGVTTTYCGNCGQRRDTRVLGVAELLRDLLQGVFSYDSKFVLTIKTLLLRPGCLTQEYVRGRRTAYLGPFQTFFWISALFFLVYGLAFSSTSKAYQPLLYRLLLCEIGLTTFLQLFVCSSPKRLLVEHLVFAVHVFTFLAVVASTINLIWFFLMRLTLAAMSLLPYEPLVLLGVLSAYYFVASQSFYHETRPLTALKTVGFIAFVAATSAVLWNLFEHRSG